MLTFGRCTNVGLLGTVTSALVRFVFDHTHITTTSRVFPLPSPFPKCNIALTLDETLPV